MSGAGAGFSTAARNVVKLVGKEEKRADEAARAALANAAPNEATVIVAIGE